MNIHTYISAKKKSLELHPFIQSLSVGIHSEQSLAFVPSMTFFVLGFRDILNLARIEKPENEIEKDLNQHCDEDSEHYRLFINDLSLLESVGIPFSTFNAEKTLLNVWSDDTYDVREHTYRVASYMMNAKTVEEKMLIIDCLEAAFCVFITHLNYLTKQVGLYEQLRYLGHEHYMEEAEHSGGSWIDDTAKREVNISRFREDYIKSAIDNIFDGFDNTFECWNRATFNTERLVKVAV